MLLIDKFPIEMLCPPLAVTEEEVLAQWKN